METIIGIAVLVLILGGAIFYIVRAKKRGAKCIGCPTDCSCSSHDKKGAGCGCGCCGGDDGSGQA